MEQSVSPQEPRSLHWMPCPADCFYFLLVAALIVGMSLRPVSHLYPFFYERGVCETLSAFLALVAALAYGDSFRRARKQGATGAAQLVRLTLAVFLFLLAGEETSWGQQLFGFETPEGYAKINMQGETNLHNLNTELSHAVYYFVAYLWGIYLPGFLKAWPVPMPRRTGLGLPLADRDASFAFCLGAVLCNHHDVISLDPAGADIAFAVIVCLFVVFPAIRRMAPPLRVVIPETPLAFSLLRGVLFFTLAGSVLYNQTAFLYWPNTHLLYEMREFLFPIGFALSAASDWRQTRDGERAAQTSPPIANHHAEDEAGHE